MRRSSGFRCSRVACGCLLLLGMAMATNAQWTVVNLHPAGVPYDSVVNGAGKKQQVGYAQVGPTVGHFRASMWSATAGSWVNLHPTGVGYSIGYAGDDVEQVGEYDPAGFPRAALWRGSSASFVDLQPAGVINSIAYGVARGQQVGYTNIGYSRAALWNGSVGSFVDLNPPPTGEYVHTSIAYATDGYHQVGSWVDVNGVTSAALWSGSSGSLVNLHPAGNISSWAYAVSGNQQAGVVRVPNTSSHAAVWTGSAGSWVDLHPAGALNSQAYAVFEGRQVGRVVDANVQIHATLWASTAASRVDLHAFLPASFLSSEAHGISSYGGFTYVSGFGYNSATNRTEAIVWVTPRLSPVIKSTTVTGPGF